VSIIRGLGGNPLCFSACLKLGGASGACQLTQPASRFCTPVQIMAGASIQDLSQAALSAVEEAGSASNSEHPTRAASSAVAHLTDAAEHRALSQHAEIERLRSQVASLETQNEELQSQKETLINALRSEHDHLAGDSLFHTLSECMEQIQQVMPTLSARASSGSEAHGKAKKPLPRRSPRRRTQPQTQQMHNLPPPAVATAFPRDVSAIIAESHTSPLLDSSQWSSGPVKGLLQVLHKTEAALSAVAQLQRIAAEAAVESANPRVPRRLKPPPLPVPSHMGRGCPAAGSAQRGLRILTMDGGGVRGVVMIEALRKLEYECGRQVHELFDLMVGTSSGGFLAALVGIKRTSLAEAAEVYNHVRLALCQISPMWQNVKRLATGVSHSADVARAYLLTVFGDGMLRDAPPSPKVAMLGTSIDTDPAQPFLFRSYQLSPAATERTLLAGSCDMPVYQAARATSSAPTYYEPELINGQRYVDGGISANNPVLVALAEAAVLWPSRPVECLVSLGTGVPTLRPGNVVALTDWLGVVFGLSMSSHTAHYIANALLPRNVYFRLDAPSVGDFNLTEGDAGVTCDMIRAGQAYVCEKHALFSQVADSLAPSRSRKGAPAPLCWPPTDAFMQPVIEQEQAADIMSNVPAGSPSSSPAADVSVAADAMDAPPPSSAGGGLAATLRCSGRGKRPREDEEDAQIQGTGAKAARLEEGGGGGGLSWLAGVPLLGGLLTPASSPVLADSSSHMNCSSEHA